MMAFIRDPLAYFAVIFLVVPFIPFMVGAFLTDYTNNPDLKISDGARSVSTALGILLFFLFFASNAQAVIIFGILMVIITVVTIYFIWIATHPKPVAKQVAKKAYREFRQNIR